MSFQTCNETTKSETWRTSLGTLTQVAGIKQSGFIYWSIHNKITSRLLDIRTVLVLVHKRRERENEFPRRKRKKQLASKNVKRDIVILKL